MLIYHATCDKVDYVEGTLSAILRYLRNIVVYL